MSPELFNPEIQDSNPTKLSDCYALGMVIYEVLSGRIPFYQLVNFVVPGMVLGGERPVRLEGLEGVWFMDDVWTILERCWAPQPNDRPGVGEVLRCLGEVSGVWTPPSPQVVASPSITDPPSWNPFYTRTEESTDGGDVSPPPQIAPPQPPKKPLSNGDADDGTLDFSARALAPLYEAADREDLRVRVEGLNSSDLEGSGGIVNVVGLMTLLDVMDSEYASWSRQEMQAIHPPSD
jgi:hypothetical protein